MNNKLAIEWGDLIQTSVPNFSGRTDLASLFSGTGSRPGIITLVFFFAGGVFLLNLVMGGFQLLTSQGDPKGVSAARGKITNAFIGFFVVFAAYWIVQLIALILGLGSITDVFQ